MKTYTNIEQSKKLAEILPVESADMCFNDNEPCWSLAALLNALPISIDNGRYCLALINSCPDGGIEWLCCYEDDNGNILKECYADNQVDACVQMAIKLKEEKII